MAVSQAGDDIRWQAVAERDARFNGTFVYAVSSTGILLPAVLPFAPPPSTKRSLFLVGR